MEIMKEALPSGPTLKTCNVSDGSGLIVVGVDTSLEQWGQLYGSQTKLWTGTCVAMRGELGIKLRKDVIQDNMSVVD